jgi:hypothetical protein
LDAYRTDRKFYTRILPGNDALFFDVGANIGSVVGTGPQGGCLRAPSELRDGNQSAMRPYKQRLHIEKCALSDSPSEAILLVRESISQSSMSSTWKGEPLGTIEVPVSIFDSTIHQFGLPLYSKIGVEG